jgi:glutamate-1-semialdehyde 2,1-aminomutase
VKTDVSARLDERLRARLPGGNTRAATFYPPFPVALTSGSGFVVRDIDGNEYIDVLNNYTSTVHGHGHPKIVEAIVGQASRGMLFPAPGVGQAELAERITGRIASIEHVRFTNSGTEAVMMAVRAARAFTGRDAIVKARGGYHGSWEQVAASPDANGVPAAEVSEAAGRPRRRSDAGIPTAVRRLVHEVTYNDTADLERAMAEHGASVAAVILEPVIGEETIRGDLGFLAAARRLATEHGAVLIFDEVVTARLHFGGIQTSIGISPDLTTLGKIIGGGLPVGAFGGRADIMAIFDPRQPDYLPHHGTFNGNALTMAAGCVSLDLLSQSEIDRINLLGDQLAAGLSSTFEAASVPFSVTSVGSLVLIHAASNGDLAGLHRAALEEGVYLAPRGLMSVSTAMDAATIQDVIERMGRAVARAVRGSELAARVPA